MLLREVQAFATARNKLKSTQYPLKPHQVEGVKWMIGREMNSKYKGGLVCDDPGLGKTLQTIGIMLANPVKNTLIVVPTSVLNQWHEICSLIFGADKCYIHYGKKRAHTIFELLQKMNTSTVVITSYALISDPLNKSNQHTILHSVSWNRVVLDEGHLIRNPSTLTHKMASDLHSTHRWILTGTPIQNKRKDIISLFKFIGIPPALTKSNLEYYISTYLLRRNKKLLFDKSFKDYKIINHNCEFATQKEQDIFKLIQEDSIKEFLAKEEEMEGNIHMFLLEILLRLRQASVHPMIAIDSLKKKFPDENWSDKYNFQGISTKILACISKIKEMTGLSLVFCHFRQEMELMKYYLSLKGIKSEIFDGTMNIKQRNHVLEQYSKENAQKKYKLVNGKIVQKPFDKPTVLLIQIKAGGVGLNLQQFQNIFIMSPDWNPCNEIQAIARAHRIGQTEDVSVNKFTLISNPKFEKDTPEKPFTTIDERILFKQTGKCYLMKTMLNDSTLTFRDIMVGKGRITKSCESTDLAYLLLG